jgi:hypothetical protein
LSLGFNAKIFAQEEAKFSDFDWEAEGRGGRRWVTIKDYFGSSKTIKFPSLTPDGPIEVIGPHAFEQKGLTALNLSEDVKRIEDYACADNRLTQITIPLSTTFIGDGAFKGNRLASLTLPGGLMEIGRDAFRGNQLKAVTIPVDEINISSGAFLDNPSITKIVIGSNAYLEDDSFPNNFAAFYESHERAGGAYTFSGGKWYAESEMQELLAAQEAARRQEEERKKRLAMQRELEQELAAIGKLPPQIEAEQQQQQRLELLIYEEQQQKERTEAAVFQKRNRVNELDGQLHTVDEDIYDHASLSITGQSEFLEDARSILLFKYRGVFDNLSIAMQGKTEYLTYSEKEELPENERLLYMRLKETLSFGVKDYLFVDINNYNHINTPAYLEEIISGSAVNPSTAFHSGTVSPGLRMVYANNSIYRITVQGEIPFQYDSSMGNAGLGLSALTTLYLSALSLTGGINWNTLDYSLSSGDIMDADGFNFSASLQYEGEHLIIGADWSQNSKKVDKYGMKLGFRFNDVWEDRNGWYIIADLLKDEYDISEYGVTWGYSLDKWGCFIRLMHYESGVTGSSGPGVRCALELKF